VQAAAAEGLGRWLVRRFAWAVAWEWLGAGKKPQYHLASGLASASAA
jgi:hypothetical protein